MIKYKGGSFYIATLSLLLFIATIIFFSFVWQGSVEYKDIPILGKVFIFAGMLGGFAFWFSMLADFFKNTDIKNRVAWGFCLIFFWWVASLLYFFMHFLPRRKLLTH